MADAPATPETPPVPPTPEEIEAETAAAEAAIAREREQDEAAKAAADAAAPPSFDISTAAEKAAADAGLDVKALVASGALVGTGKDGSITKGDITAYVRATTTAALDDNGNGRVDRAESGARLFRLADGATVGLTIVAGGETRLMVPGSRYRFDASDPAVKAHLAAGRIVTA